MKRQEPSSQDVSFALKRLMVPKNNERGPQAAELFFAALHGTYRAGHRVQPVTSFEIVSINKFIQFYFGAPNYLKEFVEGQLYAQYPNLEITSCKDYSLNVTAGKYAVGLDLVTTKDDVFPIKTFQSFEADPISGITSVLSQLAAEDELWIQICVSPIDDSWQKKGVGYVNAIRAGRDPSEPLWKSFAKGVFGMAKVATSPTTQPPAEKSADISGPLQLALKGIETKTTKLGFRTVIRVISISNNYTKAKQHLSETVAAFKQFNLVNMNGFSAGMIVEGQTALDLYRSRGLGSRPYILNIEELASIYHLPGITVVTPSMDWAGSRKGEPPQNLPLLEEIPAEEVSVLGTTNFRNEEKQFGIKIRDRLLHLYAIGKTGTGKSTFLGSMIIDDIIKGRGVAVVDPHGDLINDVLDYIPEERINDVIYFSPADRDFPIGFNLLENVNPEYKNIVASGIVGIFKKIFGESWGPRLEYILRNVVLGLLDYPGATLLDILKVLSDAKYRRGVIEKISDPVIKDFFLSEFERYDQKFRQEAIAPIQNKVGQFLSSTIIRNIVGQEKSTVDMRQAMDTKKILLLDLSIGKIGEDNSALLGAMLITKIQMAAMGRADLKKEQRIPFYLYVDEFQNFATDSFAVILSEARKYGLALTVTNQYIAQMPEKVASAVFGNVGTLVTFRVGAQDADFLNREFVPVFEPADLTNLNNFNIYVKMAIDGVTSTPFSARTLLTTYNPTGNVQRIIEQSRTKYSKPRIEVEDVITQKTLTNQPSIEELRGTIGKGAKKDSDVAEKTGNLKEKEVVPDTKDENLPEKLQNVKEAEDYDTKRWYFLNRTDFREVAGRNEDGTAKNKDSAESEKKKEPELTTSQNK